MKQSDMKQTVGRRIPISTKNWENDLTTIKRGSRGGAQGHVPIHGNRDLGTVGGPVIDNKIIDR